MFFLTSFLAPNPASPPSPLRRKGPPTRLGLTPGVPMHHEGHGVAHLIGWKQPLKASFGKEENPNPKRTNQTKQKKQTIKIKQLTN